MHRAFEPCALTLERALLVARGPKYAGVVDEHVHTPMLVADLEGESRFSGQMRGGFIAKTLYLAASVVEQSRSLLVV